MSKPIRFGSAVSLAVMASVLAACAAPQGKVASAARGESEIGLATRALAALGSNDIPAAIDYAEKAVEKSQGDAAVRTLLGNTYFAGGRFWSAESAYKDSLAINSNQPQVILKLALVETALGKTDEAVMYLNAGRGILEPADFGLAMALAGRTGEALDVLQVAARSRVADARVRQNLALVLALTGDWVNARTVAAQDVPADQLDARIQQWMQLANPSRTSDQVAALVGVKPAAKDQGQPLRLALVKSETRLAQADAPAAVQAPEPGSMAVAELAPPPFPPASFAPVQVADAAPVPEATDTAALPPFAQIAVPPAPPPPNPRRVAAKSDGPAVAKRMSAPLAKAAAASEEPAPMPNPVRAAKAKPRLAAAAKAVHAPRHSKQGAVVQLGAYGSPQRVNQAWQRLTASYPALRAYLPMRAKFVSSKGTFYRLSITGFANHREALERCQLLKSRGGNCFVRGFAGDAPVQYASR